MENNNANIIYILELKIIYLIELMNNIILLK